MKNVYYKVETINKLNFWDSIIAKRYKSVIIEIGSSDGDVLVKMANKYRNSLIIGIELRNRFAQITAGRIIAKRIKNAIVVNGDANQLFDEGYFPNESINEIHIYFPSPNNIRRRDRFISNINNRKFVKNAYSIVKTGGIIKMLTDEYKFFKYFNSIMDRSKWNEVQFFSDFENSINGLLIESDWEYLCYYQELDIYTLQLEKR